MSDDFAIFSKIINERYSCRGYLETEVSEQDIRDIVATASRAPTWCNAQPWKVIVTRGAETRAFAEMLTKAAETTQMEPDFAWPLQYTGEYQDRRRVCGYQLYEAVGIARDDKARRAEQMMQNFRFFGAPHVAIITSDADLGPYGAMDCGGFIALFSLVARAKGIASVVQASVTGYAPAIRQYFQIPANRRIQTAISFGYEDLDHPANGFRTERADSDNVVTFVG
ncbi:nitroreductase [Pararhodobacter sp.]|uniref:nitroreductase n=1 Tax=Pararhodobacter sp. TaxID=2127056 RepID=UPI002AFF5BD7|nr:nitroreductase [Pararhodobacter sp.]